MIQEILLFVLLISLSVGMFVNVLSGFASFPDRSEGHFYIYVINMIILTIAMYCVMSLTSY